jgi:hypothetical protein
MPPFTGIRSSGVGESVSVGELDFVPVVGDGIDAVVKLTQAAYDALGTPDASTLYVIVG